MNLVFITTAIFFAVASILRRKHDIGGWLLYFYYWIFAFLFVYAQDAIKNAWVLAPWYFPKAVNQEALIAAVFPRFAGVLVVAVIAAILLVRREKAWLERIRVSLLAEAVIAGSSVLLDIFYFPRSTFVNTARWIGLCCWVIYFHRAKRVQRAFAKQDLEAPLTERVMT